MRKQQADSQELAVQWAQQHMLSTPVGTGFTTGSSGSEMGRAESEIGITHTAMEEDTAEHSEFEKKERMLEKNAKSERAVAQKAAMIKERRQLALDFAVQKEMLGMELAEKTRLNASRSFGARDPNRTLANQNRTIERISAPHNLEHLFDKSEVKIFGDETPEELARKRRAQQSAGVNADGSAAGGSSAVSDPVRF